MSAPHYLLALALAAVAGRAHAQCPASLLRDPAVLELVATDGGIAPVAKSTDDFAFVDDATTVLELMATVGTPNASRGARTLLWCLENGTVVTVTTTPTELIKSIRSGGELIYRRK